MIPEDEEEITFDEQQPVDIQTDKLMDQSLASYQSGREVLDMENEEIG